MRGIHRSPVNSPHKGQWRGALMFSLIYVWINGGVNNREAGDLRRYRTHYDVIVMSTHHIVSYFVPKWANFLLSFFYFAQVILSGHSSSCVRPSLWDCGSGWWPWLCVLGSWNYWLPEASIGLRVLSLPASVCVCVCPSVCQSRACPSDNSWPVSARITKFGP